ncbi:DUF2278 family protein [Paraflavitalea pollutisoli]|uniref:DUF2278 family protein n=1 Tax=Paraflavitalea pollutisoli TaxID=3034143 RepID=UPI0023ED250C|nr:DUF2278 family protein [Paraflavitalea sp. H1-2-19X]
MPLKNYGVLKGHATEVRLATNQNAHYQVRLIANDLNYRIAINVKSALEPSELEYLVLENFAHPIIDTIKNLPFGFTALAPSPVSGALDYIRGNLFERSQMRPLPFNVPGPDNDLNDKINSLMQRAMADEAAEVYAFGETWGPETSQRDRFFAFLPGNGIHDIHMNQSNVGRFVGDDGVWQDGGVLIHFPQQHQWVAIFLKFQSQGWHTDNATGHKIGDAVTPGAVSPGNVPAIGGAEGPVFNPTPGESQGLVRIIGALVNSIQSPEVESVTLLNTSPGELDITNWAILDSQKKKQVLVGNIGPGECLQIQIRQPLALSNKGGIITLIDDNGLKIDGVAYTKEQASHPGWTIVF